MISERLKIARKKKKLTQEELAKKIKATKGTVSNYENGHSSPSNEILNDLADILEVTTDYLLGRSDNPIVKESDSPKYSLKSRNPLDEIEALVKEYGIEQFGFFDIEKWKNLSPEDLDEIRRHFEWVAQKAKERNQKEDE